MGNKNKNNTVEATKVNYKKPNAFWFVIKVGIMLFFLFLFLALVSDFIARRGLIKKVYDVSGDTTFYDDYYYEKKYGSLRDLMTLYNYPDDKYYGKYWEVVEGEEHRKAYDDYKKGYEAGLDYCKELYEREANELVKMTENPRFPENKEKLLELAEGVK